MPALLLVKQVKKYFECLTTAERKSGSKSLLLVVHSHRAWSSELEYLNRDTKQNFFATRRYRVALVTSNSQPTGKPES